MGRYNTEPGAWPELPECTKEAFEIVWNRGFATDAFASFRMCESELERVKHHPWCFETDQFRETPILALAIGFIAGQRIAEVLKVNADLMRAAGVQCGFNQRGGAKPFQHLVARSGLPAGVVAHRHSFPV